MVQPTLNARSQSVGKLRSSASIYDRLHSEHAINQEQIERNEEMRISKELEGCTYRVSQHISLYGSHLRLLLVTAVHIGAVS